MKNFVNKHLGKIFVSVSSTILLAIIYFGFNTIKSTYNKINLNEQRIMRYDSTQTAKNKVQNTFIYDNRNRLAISIKQDSLILSELKTIKSKFNEFGIKQNILLKDNKKSLQKWNEVQSLIPKIVYNEEE